MSFTSDFDCKLKRWFVCVVDRNALDVDRIFRILDKVEAVKKTRKGNEHVLPPDVPSNTNSTSRSKPELSLKHVHNMIIHITLRIESSWFMVFFRIGGDMEVVTDEYCPSLKAISLVFVIL